MVLVAFGQTDVSQRDNGLYNQLFIVKILKFVKHFNISFVIEFPKLIYCLKA